MSPSFTQILNVARNGMIGRLNALDVTSNNLANINTVGYKYGRANFQEMLDNQVRSGSYIAATQNMMDQGSIAVTGNELDVAINGEGFFQITMPNGELGYTRDGRFFLDGDRNLVTSDGYYLVWDGEVPEDAIEMHFNPDGTIMAHRGDIWEEIGTVELARFPNPAGLTIHGHNLYLSNAASGDAFTGAPNAAGFGKLLGKAVENSNVNIAEEMTNIVELQRSFQMVVRNFQSTDAMMQLALRMRNR